MAKYFDYQTTQISVGDTIRVHQEITEGNKQRIQVFEGIVIAIKNRGQGQSFTVRKIASNGIGVEKIYPVHMPGIKRIEVKSKGKVRRAKLYYLRERVGKRATKVKEQPKKAKPAQTTESKPTKKVASTDNKTQTKAKATQPKTKSNTTQTKKTDEQTISDQKK